MVTLRFSILFFAFILNAPLHAQDSCGAKTATDSLITACKAILETVGDSDKVFSNIQDAIQARNEVVKPAKMLAIEDKNTPNFPVYSKCEKSFFRVATVNKAIDQVITSGGWKSGWLRRQEDLVAKGQNPKEASFDALPPTASFEDRIVQYVRVKNKPSEFPKHSSVIGVLENPIRTLSVGYHTGYNSGISGNYMRMDEIEIGPCAKSEKCKSIPLLNSTEVFAKKDLKPRYSTEGEWAVDSEIPPECVVATYRIQFQKVDDKCYSDINGNCKSK